MIITVSKRAIDIIIMSEVTSESYYNNELAHPTWPGGDSGVTIGIGYDLGYASGKRIAQDWQKLSDSVIEMLQSVAGIKGEYAHKAINPVMKDINIPFEIARDVFYNSTLSRTAIETKAVYEGVENLAPDAIGAMISLVYNRGSRLAPIEGDKNDKRKEMRELVPLIKDKNYSAMADKFIEMKRIWKNKGMNGLLARRDVESILIRNAERIYSPDELINIEI